MLITPAASEVDDLIFMSKGRTMGTVFYPTREELVEQREEILAAAGLTEPELRAKADAGLLSGGEYDALSELDVIAYLLDEAVSETV
ncbi:MAG: hypothetical protein KF680_06955 [Cryobacterium sp.]|nr:hypothetical protein [Cryobacterium sp.]